MNPRNGFLLSDGCSHLHSFLKIIFMCTSKCIFRVVPFYGEQESASPALEFGLLEGTPLHDVFAFLTPSDK